MTALGFFLYMIGRVMWEFTDEDSKAHMPFIVTGFFLLLFGITKFLWRVMP